MRPNLTHSETKQQQPACRTEHGSATMTDAPPSPKRRRILSSMNPESWYTEEKRRSASPRRTASPRSGSPSRASTSEPKHEPEKPTANNDDTTEPQGEEVRPTKFRFKSKSKHSSSSSRHRHRSSRHRDDDPDPSSRRRHHRHKRRHRTPPLPEPEETIPAEPTAAEGRLSPNAAFRESLFDAMADDEGAAYWEGVYGQPIHVYSREKPSSDGRDQERGELEKMNDDEYAEYVRRKMWEKTHAGLLEEQARREEAKKRKEKDGEEKRRIAEEMERSLRRGESRRRRKVWRLGWERYVDAWAKWDGGIEGLPWPTKSGSREEVGVEGQVREFFEKGLDRDELGEKEFSARLKEERVRWHPDKVQQKLGGTVEGDVMKDVTANFQIIDRLWNDTRSKA
ncbi:hypothetical protein GE09DRAFT_1120154 [Coniochaeta sp. 2T2.1]|nr:hypothetical protein GE09DRAFT_1120154 [Coniochaeta sp. 2T2.1]